MSRTVRLLVASSLVLTGCTALLGVNDIFLDDGIVDPGGEGGTSEAGKTDGPVSTGDGGTDATGCTADLETSKDHCGRCGHSCFGGECNAGVCQPTTFIGSLSGPRDVAFDDQYVYVSSYGDGTVKRLKKDGTGAVETIVSKWEETNYIAVGGGKLFWTTEGFHGTGSIPDGGTGNDDFGGVWSCSLPACTDKKLIGPTDVGNALVYSDPTVYSASQDDLRRFKGADGTGTQILNTSEQIVDVNVDSANIYYLTPYQLARYQPDGGGAVQIASVPGDFVGHMTTDAQRVYWTYYDAMAAGYKGYVASTLKASPGSRILYGDKNVGTLSVAADNEHVWWANAGTTPDAIDGNIMMCPVAGCPDGGATLIVDKLSFPNRVKVDGDAVYIVEFGGLPGNAGRLLRVAKP